MVEGTKEEETGDFFNGGLVRMRNLSEHPCQWRATREKIRLPFQLSAYLSQIVGTQCCTVPIRDLARYGTVNYSSGEQP